MPLLGGRSATWSATLSAWALRVGIYQYESEISIWNVKCEIRHVNSPFLTTRCLHQGCRSASWSANMSSNSRNVKLSFLTTRCLYWGCWSASWSANMSSNSRNVLSPFLTTRCLYQGLDLPVDLPIWVLTVEMSYCHSWPLDATTRVVDLPNLNTLYVSCFASQRSFRFYERPVRVSNICNLECLGN